MAGAIGEWTTAAAASRLDQASSSVRSATANARGQFIRQVGRRQPAVAGRWTESAPTAVRESPRLLMWCAVIAK